MTGIHPKTWNVNQYNYLNINIYIYIYNVYKTVTFIGGAVQQKQDFFLNNFQPGEPTKRKLTHAYTQINQTGSFLITF